MSVEQTYKFPSVVFSLLEGVGVVFILMLHTLEKSKRSYQNFSDKKFCS